VHPVFLLARFAWALFPRIRNFLTRGEKRSVKLRDESSSTEEVMELGSEELRSILRTTVGGRSNSPQKRQRGEDNSHGVTGAAIAAYKRPRLNFDDPTQGIEASGYQKNTDTRGILVLEQCWYQKNTDARRMLVPEQC